MSGATSASTAAGFKWGTSATSLNSTAAATAGSASFSATLTGLASGTTYYYQAYATVRGTGDHASETKTFHGAVKSFTTPGWLELPATKHSASHFYDHFGEGKSRNYSYCYDTGRYASLWTAYPLTYSHTQGSGHTSSWRWNPYLEQSQQVNVKDHGYEVNYGDGTYSRGHMCPNADRKSDDDQNEQTFYVTNQLPQIQNGFNSGIWSNLENAVRTLAQSTDTVYVAVGPCYRTVGGSEPVSRLTATSQDIVPQTVDIPNYFYKVLLKVKRSGDAIVSASAIGFWFEHKAYDSTNRDFIPYAVSVDQIEAWTGFDFFTALPSSLQTAAEQNSSWTAFKEF